MAQPGSPADRPTRQKPSVAHSHGETLAAAFGAELMRDPLVTELDRLRRENRALRAAIAELERVAERDTLTPLYNRRYLINMLEQRRAVAARGKVENSALLFVDVNHLKRLNDTYGHAAGDYALIEIAHRLLTNVRSSDIVARIGGDEFAIILDSVDVPVCAQKVEQLHDALACEPAHFDEVMLPISASFGWVMINGDDSSETLLAKADAAMYARKHAGKH